MKAMEGRTGRSLGWYLRHPFTTRWTRVPLLFFGGLGVTVVLALALRSNWVECRTVEEWYAQTCPIVPRRLVIMRMTGVLGALTLVFGPIVNSLYQVTRYGQAWEASRVETAVSNIPILAGLAYWGIALILALA